MHVRQGSGASVLMRRPYCRGRAYGTRAWQGRYAPRLHAVLTPPPKRARVSTRQGRPGGGAGAHWQTLGIGGNELVQRVLVAPRVALKNTLFNL
jgi:hypothetical protein